MEYNTFAHKQHSPATFELVAGKRNYLCINNALSINERHFKHAHLIAYGQEECIGDYYPQTDDGDKIDALAVGQSYVTNDGKTIIVRIY